MSVKHTILPRWATNDVIDATTSLNNVIEPAEGKKDVGWNYLEKPSRQYFNWLGRQTNQWLEYLDEALNIFAPYETDPATMAISLNAGRINQGTNVLEVATQDTGVMTAPITNPRIDRIVISETTGLASIVAGSEAASPTAPAFDRDSTPIAQILLYVGMTEIVNDDITDERASSPFTGQLADDLYLTKTTSDGIGAYFQNSTTGSTAVDGFLVGIDADEKALFWNYENTELLIAVNNALAGKVANDGKWLITPSGGDIATLIHEFTVYNSAAASSSNIHFLNDGTGITAGDGFLIGINATEQAQIWNYENTDMRFGTNDTFRGKIDNSGKWLVSSNGTDIEPIYDLVIYDSAAASDSYIQFINDGTGVGSADGFRIGIDTAEQVQLWNFENTLMLFATNSLQRMTIEADGSVEIGTGLTNQGVGTLNVLNGIYVNNVELKVVSQYTANGTTASLTTGSSDAITFTHGLGTDDVIVDLTINPTTGNNFTASIESQLSSRRFWGADSNTTTILPIPLPSSGDVRIAIRNDSLTTQTIDYRIAIRKRIL